MMPDSQQTLLKLTFPFKILSTEHIPLNIYISFPLQSWVKLFIVPSLFTLNGYNILSFKEIMLNISSYNILPLAR